MKTNEIIGYQNYNLYLPHTLILKLERQNVLNKNKDMINLICLSMVGDLAQW